jgi:hypothetical protein
LRLPKFPFARRIEDLDRVVTSRAAASRSQPAPPPPPPPPPPNPPPLPNPSSPSPTTPKDSAAPTRRRLDSHDSSMKRRPAIHG